MLSCNCLNVIIETGDDFIKVSASSLELTDEESEDAFFKEEFQQIGKLLNINKVHAGLIQARNVGSWIVHQCINCDVPTHALHREKGASCVLVHSKLLADEDISNLKNSALYSKTFNIIVYSNDSGDTINDLHVDAYLPKELQSTVKGLKEITTDTLKKETLAVEERIKKFAEQQYNELENLKDRTFREQEALIRIIISKTSEKPNVLELTTKAVQSSSNSVTKLEPFPRADFSLQISDETLKASARHPPQRQKSSPGVQSKPHGYEPMFDFDGVDEINNEPLSDLDESEDDFDDDVIECNAAASAKSGREVDVPNNKIAARGSIAKSLPVSIPTYTSQISSHDDDVNEKIPSDENVDIAASIKALAQSVHSDAIFGDLPRPRLSTLT